MVFELRESQVGWRRFLRFALILALVLLAASVFWTLRSFGQIATGFFAKNLCSGVFVAGRDQQQVVENDILVYSPKPLFAAIRWSVDTSVRVVETSLPLGLGQASASYRGGTGCALFKSGEPLKPEPDLRSSMSADDPERLWPEGSKIELEALALPKRQKLALAIERGFAEADATPERRTRAIVIVHQGRIVAERYGEGFGPQTRMAGWSMAKSVTSAWIGALTQQNLLSIDDPLALSAWSNPADPRRQLRYRELLNMSSGLEFSEAYASPFSDVNRMLFFSQSTGGYAAEKLLVAASGSQFNYSSGSTNLISLALRERLVDDYKTAPYTTLFEKIGMLSAVFETDAAGTFVGSSYVHASPRDWARFGLLYLRDGLWNQQRLLPEGWVAFSTRPAPANPNYGAHWWLHEPGEKLARTVPIDLFQATGHAGQRISVVPSRDLVIVRLGMTLNGPALRHAELIADVINALQ